MGYNTTVDLFTRRENGDWVEVDWDDERIASLAEQSGSAGYCVRECGSGKWYELADDLAAWSKAIGEDVRADVIGEDGERWRVYARAGDATTTHPEIVWPPEPWPAGVARG